MNMVPLTYRSFDAYECFKLKITYQLVRFAKKTLNLPQSTLQDQWLLLRSYNDDVESGLL
jgi:hypothetical protein